MIITLLNRVINSLLKSIGKYNSTALIEYFIKQFQFSFEVFITYFSRPIYIKSLDSIGAKFKTNVNIAILIQGPVVKENSFTLESIKLYRLNYPNAIIIFSTWDDDRVEVETWKEDLGIIFIFNSKPKFAGFSNINFQIESTKNGLLKAKELGVEFAIKTRSDQRFYAKNIDQFLLNIVSIFPLDSSVRIQKYRIVGLSLNTFKYRMYGLSDMFNFGHIDDMLLYWDIPFDDRRFNSNNIKVFNKTLRTYAEWRICEVLLATEFLIKTTHKLEWTLEDSWRAFSYNFCIIDSKSLDLYWGKYSMLEDRWLNYEVGFNMYEELSFKDWLNLYSNINNIEFPEELLDVAF
jgi:hypothetical protein